MADRIRLAAVVALVALALAPLAAACPLCSETLGEDGATGDPSSLARGYFWTILLMIGTPFTVGGTLAALVYREVRRRGADEARPATAAGRGSDARA